MGTVNTPQLPPQSTPPLDDRGGDASLPPLFSRVWWLFLNSVVNSLRALSAQLTTPGALPKVTDAGTLGESAITDTGNQVIIVEPGVPYGTKFSVGPGLVTLQQTGSAPEFPYIEFRDNTAARGAYVGWGSATVFGIYLEHSRNLVVSGGNAGFGGNTSPGEVIDATGNANVSGVYKVAGTQVVGARGAAVTSPSGGGTSVAAPSGGGTSVSAPAGGTVIDVQARTAIASIISAISSSGNTVDPAARTAIASIITAISSSGNTVDPAARTAIDAIRSRISTHGLTS